MRNTKMQAGLLGIVSIMAVSIFITIAWAGFSSNLKISGTATVAKQSWSISLSTSNTETITYPKSLIGESNLTATGNATKPTAEATGLRMSDAKTITGTIGTLNQPGDKLTYSGLYIDNYGTFDASISFSGLRSTKLTNGTNIDLECTSLDSSALDDDAAQTFCDTYVIATFTYGTEDSAVSPVDSDTFTLNKNGGTTSSMPFTMTFEYMVSDSTSALSPADINIQIKEFTITATQI